MQEEDLECSNSLKCIDNSRDSVLHKMYVSNVGNRLREMQTPSDIDCQRWPWELMQNAKDSISGTNRDSVEVILEITDDSVIFQHDGCPFNGKTYLALLYKYSEGKANNTESTGRFGTGFLTTHSLSKVVKMEGPIIDEDETICGFEVTMYRDGKNNEELIDGMIKMENEKKFWRKKHPRWTKFNYILKTKRNIESSKLGAYNFKINIVLTMLFNQKFKKVELKSKDINLIYEKNKELQKEEKNNIEIIAYTLTNVNINELKSRVFLHSKINEKSEELTEHFDKERYLTVECALEIDPTNKTIICNEKSPCLFCSLPLVGSENHILPFILNSNDFEPSTERQEILLDGAEIKKDEKRNNKEVPTDVGINRYILRRSYELFGRIVKYCSENKYNNLHLLCRGLKDIPNVGKYFDKKWYLENYMKDMRNILYKYPIIYNTNDELSLIKEMNFPIYDKYEEKFTEIYYKLVKELYIYVPRYEESIQWSKYLWENGLETNRIDIHKLIDKYNESKHSIEYNNCFIKFIWENYKELTFTKRVLINQENEYILYNEKEFAQSINVNEDIINCVEELGNKWRQNHLKTNITSIDIPIKHNIDFAINIIKKAIDNDKENSYILARYVEKNNKKRETIYHLSKLLFEKKIREKYIVEDFKEEIWRDADTYLINKMVETAESWDKFSSVALNVEDYNILLNFFYENNNRIFDNKKLLPSINGYFYFLKDLYMEYNINNKIKEGAKKYTDLNFNDKILNPLIKINNLNIAKYCNDDLLNEINKFFQDKLDSLEKVELSKILIHFLPELEENEMNKNIIQKHNNIREIYSFIYKESLEREILNTKVNTIWNSIDKYIMVDIQNKLQKLKKLEENSLNNYIEFLNKYQNFFDFNEYNLIPNSYGKLLNICELKDFNDIPVDILDGIKKVFYLDLKSISTYKGIKIHSITKISFLQIGDIIQKCFANKKKEDEYMFNYKTTFDLSKIIIKYVPINEERKEYQVRLYKLYKLFDKSIGNMIEVDSYENLYRNINESIVQYINEKINDCKDVSGTKKYINDIFQFINENSDLLHPNEYNILPNQEGELKKLYELYKDNKILEELKDIASDLKNIRKLLMDNKITKFIPDKIMTNEYLKNIINEGIEYRNIDIRKILQYFPKNDNNKKQKDIKFLYENLCYKDKKPWKEYEIDLEPSFWEKANEYALKKCIKLLKEQKSLKDIDSNEEKALLILETLYKYIRPELPENSYLKIIPNQYGKLFKYSELNEEKELNQNFKRMLKDIFNYDISFYLKHKKLKLKLPRELSINNEIILIIEEGFREEKPKKFGNWKDNQNIGLLKKAKELIKFYPNKKENNYVFSFIECYKALAEEDFEEEEINTSMEMLWDKAIKILLNELLEIIDIDKNISETSSRIKLDEDKTIEKLNILYSILFKFELNKRYTKLNFIPNMKGVYKKLNEIFSNNNIDEELIKILSLLNEKESFEHKLIHQKINLNKSHAQKSLEDIATVIDKEIKTQYTKIDIIIQSKEEVKIDDNLKQACGLLIQKWFRENKGKIDLFEFTKNHLVDISVKILLDKKIKDILENLLINDPTTLIEILNFQNPMAPILWSDESMIDDISEMSMSINETRDNSLVQQNNFNHMNFLNFINGNNDNNNDNIINNNNINDDNNIINIGNNNNIIRNRRNNNYNNYLMNIIRNRYDEGIHNYCLSQAYVYEELLASNLFDEINWKNRLDENEYGELITLNEHRYKVKKVVETFDFIVKTKQNKQYKISVKRGDKSRNNYLKFAYTSSQWDLFKNEPQNIIFAFVSLNRIHPEIIFAKNIDLRDL